MANIRKTFNFRNGIQVDNQNLIVDPLGKVGIGTTIPTEILDVRGNLKVVGLVTASQAYFPAVSVGVITAQSISFSNTIIGAGISISATGISISAGVITASSGIVTYYGDGGYLINVPTSQWISVVGVGYTSIYNKGFVGVMTTRPIYAFQVSGDQNATFITPGVGIDSSGNIYATGVTTAYKFVGIGSNLTLLNASNISSGTISADRISSIYNSSLPSNINISGIITASSINASSINASGIITAQTRFSGNLIGNVVGLVTGNLVGIATTARDLTSDATVTITSVTSNLSRSGIATVDTRLDINGSVGVGTSGSGVKADVHVVRSGISSIQVTSFSGEASITVGRTLEQRGSSGSLKYGNTIGLYPYSTPNSLDIINYDIGNINNYLQLGNSSGINTGAFNWINGQDPTNPLLTLTYTGNLGIGNTKPTNKLDVTGNASITGSISGSNVSATSVTTQNLTVTGTAVLPPAPQTNLNLTTGISTFNNIKVNDTVNVGLRLGIGTDNVINPYSIQVGTGVGGNVVTIFNNGIAIGSTTPTNAAINAVGGQCFFGAIGVGTGALRCGTDFADAGKGSLANAYAFMLLPRLTSTQRTILSPEEGAVIYNLTSHRLEVYNGTGWCGIATVA